MKERARLTEEKATLFITLYARALDYRSKHSLLHDKWAHELIETIDYDFSKLDGIGNPAMAVRSRHFDDWVREFIQAHPNAVVVYLGCGLDGRVFRIDPPPTVSWYDVDYKEVIEWKERLYGRRAGYYMISSSVTDAGWLQEIPRDRPALILTEGLLEYLEERDVKALLNRVTTHFKHGQILMDVMSTLAIRSGKEKLRQTTGAVHKWAVDDLQQVDDLDLRMKRIDTLSVLRSPYIRKAPLKLRIFLRLMSLYASFRNMLRLLRYEF